MLKVKDVCRITGWSEYRVLKLISVGKLRAVDVGTGVKPRWEIRQVDLDELLTPKEVIEAEVESTRKKKRERLDAGLPNIMRQRVQPLANIFAD